MYIYVCIYMIFFHCLCTQSYIYIHRHTYCLYTFYYMNIITYKCIYIHGHPYRSLYMHTVENIHTPQNMKIIAGR